MWLYLCVKEIYGCMCGGGPCACQSQNVLTFWNCKVLTDLGTGSYFFLCVCLPEFLSLPISINKQALCPVHELGSCILYARFVKWAAFDPKCEIIHLTGCCPNHKFSNSFHGMGSWFHEISKSPLISWNGQVNLSYFLKFLHLPSHPHLPQLSLTPTITFSMIPFEFEIKLMCYFVLIVFSFW